MVEYMRGTYRDAIVEFRNTLAQIAEKQRWNVDDARQRLSNALLNQIFFK